MYNKNKNIEQQVFAKMKQSKQGTLFFIEQFDVIAENAAIRKALQRLTESRHIVRVAQGIYVIPKQNKLIGAVLPNINEVAKAIAKRDRARIVATGAQALNILGLSTQIPVNSVYLTDGAARTVKVGSQTIKFKKTTPKNLSTKGEISSLVIQALKSIGKDKVKDEERLIILKHLCNEKPENILYDSKLAPAWVSEMLKKAIIK
jgi:hypothetical protein